MSATEPRSAKTAVIMTHEAIDQAVDRLAQGIISRNGGVETVVLLGILTRGRPLADRIANRIEAITQVRTPVGSLATILYRDDFRAGKGPVTLSPRETHFDFDVNGATAVLVDDVIASGRTIRAALDEVMDYGRPARVQLACLIDRGLRELPIQPDYLGEAISTTLADHVSVHLEETDGDDQVILEPGGSKE